MFRPATLPLCLLLACNGNEPASPSAAPPAAPSAAEHPVNAASQSPVVAAKSQTTLVAPASGPGEGNKQSGRVPGPQDPAWLRVDLFPGATVISTGRTARDGAGLSSTQLLLALPEGTTREHCVQTITQALAGALPALERKDSPDGRVTLTGSNDDYAATLICGEAKGKMSAYLSYRWLHAPAPQAP